ncbi:MAG: hypothetical protein IIC67_02785 [Thaumarchaeota archaeon]|nr:hypothetical protein [Nitrososphaerota archaeon]
MGKLTDYEKRNNKERRRLLIHIKKLLTNKTHEYKYHYENDFGFGVDGKPKIVVNHELRFNWITIGGKA